MKQVIRHIVHFILGSSFCIVLMALMSWDIPSEYTQYKLIGYAATMTGLFFSCVLHENGTRKPHDSD